MHFSTRVPQPLLVKNHSNASPQRDQREQEQEEEVGEMTEDEARTMFQRRNARRGMRFKPKEATKSMLCLYVHIYVYAEVSDHPIRYCPPPPILVPYASFHSSLKQQELCDADSHCASMRVSSNNINKILHILLPIGPLGLAPSSYLSLVMATQAFPPNLCPFFPLEN